MIDGVVFHRPRAVPTIAFYFQAEVDVILFAGLHSQQHTFAMFRFEVARIGVDAVFRVDPVAMILCEPLCAVGFTASFVSRKIDDEVTRGNPAFFLQANKSGDQDGVALLNVRGAAAIEKAIHFVELEWIHGPILRQGLYHVEVRDKQDRLARTAPAQADNKILLIRHRAIDMDIFSGPARRPKASSHSFRRRRYIAGRRISCVDFNELLKNVTSGLMFRRKSSLRLDQGGAAQQSDSANRSKKTFNHCALDYKV